MNKGNIQDTNIDKLPIKEAAKIYGYTEQHLSLLCRTGELKAERDGKKWFTRKKWMEDYMEKLKEQYKRQENYFTILRRGGKIPVFSGEKFLTANLLRENENPAPGWDWDKALLGTDFELESGQTLSEVISGEEPAVVSKQDIDAQDVSVSEKEFEKVSPLFLPKMAFAFASVLLLFFGIQVDSSNVKSVVRQFGGAYASLPSSFSNAENASLCLASSYSELFEKTGNKIVGCFFAGREGGGLFFNNASRLAFGVYSNTASWSFGALPALARNIGDSAVLISGAEYSPRHFLSSISSAVEKNIADSLLSDYSEAVEIYPENNLGYIFSYPPEGWLPAKFSKMGISVGNSAVRAREFVAEKIISRGLSTEFLEMKDSATGEIWCVKISKGVWDKTKGLCSEGE
ncbi:MAG: helix-turn-helix domain-containing protein [Candidatus Pacebacteria bacterium]|nr:helix-turn-helix domain-containing protein [Candidatus Paceibacterota bacterium]